MSDGLIQVNFSTVQNASSEVRQTAARIQSQLEDLKAGVSRIANSWQGAAQQGYQARQAQWDAKAADLQQALSKIAQLLDQAASRYQDTEHKNAALWG
ncbi:hypothetical protein GCM10009760_60900 [Kitasatospora kazusensis]|uniref:ESAT-6-like protein n=1 Tax=Kitasatospora kazusensis TaxID=407974 RepID=A0ABN3AAW3_9ACTN